METESNQISIAELKRMKQGEYTRKFLAAHPGYNKKYAEKWNKNNPEKVAEIQRIKSKKYKLKKALESENFSEILCAYIAM